MVFKVTKYSAILQTKLRWLKTDNRTEIFMVFPDQNDKIQYFTRPCKQFFQFIVFPGAAEHCAASPTSGANYFGRNKLNSNNLQTTEETMLLTKGSRNYPIIFDNKPISNIFKRVFEHHILHIWAIDLQNKQSSNVFKN